MCVYVKCTENKRKESLCMYMCVCACHCGASNSRVFILAVIQVSVQHLCEEWYKLSNGKVLTFTIFSEIM